MARFMGLSPLKILSFLTFISFLMITLHMGRLKQPLKVFLEQALLEAVEENSEDLAQEDGRDEGKGDAQEGLNGLLKTLDNEKKHANDKGLQGVGSKPIDLLNMTLEEVKMLSTLISQHNAHVAQKESSGDPKEKLTLLKNEVAKQVKLLETANKRLALYQKELEKEEEKNINEVVKMFESMKPQEAAPIFSNLPPRVLFLILERMKGMKTGAILAQLSPEKAAQITTVMTDLARSRSL